MTPELVREKRGERPPIAVGLAGVGCEITLGMRSHRLRLKVSGTDACSLLHRVTRLVYPSGIYEDDMHVADVLEGFGGKIRQDEGWASDDSRHVISFWPSEHAGVTLYGRKGLRSEVLLLRNQRVVNELACLLTKIASPNVNEIAGKSETIALAERLGEAARKLRDSWD